MTVAVTVVIVLLAIGVIGYGIRGNVIRQHWEKPLRDEMRARPATFRAQVAMRFLDGPPPVRGPFSLSVHGDAFEVAQRVPVIGFLNGSDYCYRAQDSTVETVHGVLHDWIEICGLPGTGAEPIQISGGGQKSRLLWDVLVSAGAHPIGPPPTR
jgi:hypothetical protein